MAYFSIYSFVLHPRFLKLLYPCIMWSGIFWFYIGSSYAQADLTSSGSIYEEDFQGISTGFSDLGWSTEDSNGDNNTWFEAILSENLFAAIFSDAAQNDWLFSEGLSLTGGHTYKVTFNRAAFSGATQTMNVHIGSSQNSSVMGSSLQNFSFSEEEFTESSFEFTASATGTFYIGFHANSSASTVASAALLMDNVTIENTTTVANDIAITDITPGDIADCSTFTAMAAIVIKVTNEGTDNQTSAFDIDYKLVDKDGATVSSGTESIASLNAGASTDVTITADLSTPQKQFTLTVTNKLSSDEKPVNDELAKTFVNPLADLTTDGAIYEEGFEATSSLEEIGWTTENLNSDDYAWEIFEGSDFSNSGDNFLINFRSDAEAANDWLFSNCLDLKGGETYRITFHRRANGGEDEKLSLHVGTSPASTGMTVEINEYNFNENEYTEVTEEYTPDSDGIYYLGWYMSSDKADDDGSLGIMLDDVSVLNIAPNDIEITDISFSAEGCGDFTSNTSAEIKITNVGDQANNNFEVVWKLKDEDEKELDTGTLSVTSEMAVNAGKSFDLNLNLSSFGLYELTAYRAEDDNPSNDTLTTLLLNPLVDLTSGGSSFTNDFESLGELLSYGFDGANDTWFFDEDADLARSGTNFAAGVAGVTGTLGSRIMFSNCFLLNSAVKYRVNYFVRTGNVAENVLLYLYNENFELVRVLSSETVTSDGSYTELTKEFAVSDNGTYYLSWVVGTNAATAGFVLLDDITVTHTNESAPTTVPAVPTNLVATNSGFDNTLTWTDNSGDEVGFVVFRSLASGQDYVIVGDTDAGMTSYTDAGLTQGNRFYYVVAAENLVGFSNFSEEANALVTSLEANHLSKQTLAYPNPSTGEFTIEMPHSPGKNTSVEIFNNIGKRIQAPTSLQQNSLGVDMRNLQKGNYIIKINTPKGTFSKKVLIR